MYTATVYLKYDINSLPNNKFLDLSKLKAFADGKIEMSEIVRFLLGRVEKIVVKEKMLVNSIFSSSHNVFKRLFSQGR